MNVQQMMQMMQFMQQMKGNPQQLIQTLIARRGIDAKTVQEARRRAEEMYDALTQMKR